MIWIRTYDNKEDVINYDNYDAVWFSTGEEVPFDCSWRCKHCEDKLSDCDFGYNTELCIKAHQSELSPEIVLRYFL